MNFISLGIFSWSFFVPDRCRVATGLISAINAWRDYVVAAMASSSCAGHQTRGVLRPDNVYFNADIWTRVQGVVLRRKHPPHYG